MKDIVLFGTGDRGKKLFDLFYHYGIEMQYWIDSDLQKWNTKLEGKPIYSPSKIRNRKDIYVYISAVDAKKEMYHLLLEYGIPKDKIKTFSEAVIDCMSEHFMWKNSDRANERTNVILDCSNGMVLGGVEAWCMCMLYGLRERGHETYLLSPHGEYDVKGAVKQNVLWINSKPEMLFDWENLEHMLGVLQLQSHCILIANCVNDLLLAACSLKKRHPESIKIIAVIHRGLLDTYKEYSELNQYIEKYVAVSKDIQCGMKKYGIAEEKVLHMTCPVECIEPYVRKYSLNKEEPIKIGYAGRIEIVQKRINCFIEILEKLEKAGTNYCVEVAGEGDYLPQFSEEIKKLGIEHKVKLVGRLDRERIPCFWSKQDICINLSDSEGRSISVMEAMKNGAVPIVTNTSGVREDIEDGVNGYIVDVGDYIKIADKIDYLSTNRRILPVFGTLSHEVMMQKNNMETHISFWHNLLNGLE